MGDRLDYPELFESAPHLCVETWLVRDAELIALASPLSGKIRAGVGSVCSRRSCQPLPQAICPEIQNPVRLRAPGRALFTLLHQLLHLAAFVASGHFCFMRHGGLPKTLSCKPAEPVKYGFCGIDVWLFMCGQRRPVSSLAYKTEPGACGHGGRYSTLPLAQLP